MYVDLLTGTRKNFVNLHKAAKRKLKAHNAEHVAFGLDRNPKGQLSTFFKVFADDAAFYEYVESFRAANPKVATILAVHR